MRAKLLAAVAGAAALVGLAVWTAARWLGADAPPRPLVLFVVLDTVRADRTSLCGYSRPTTPTLERLAREGACTCDAISPGSWTLPSHASFFTGRPVLEHGADFAARGGNQAWWDPQVAIRPLDARLPTLAEQFRAEGYRTLAYSANPVIDPASGLTRGFDRFAACAVDAKCGSPRANREVRRLLADEEEGAPLFLFVNYMDAHHPWAPVPEGVPWAAATRHGEKSGETQRFMRGEMSPVRAKEFLARRGDLYDWGVHRADEGLGFLLDTLRAEGRLAHGLRLVVTSDHGELLGEHGLLDHGLSLHEENNRVPLCVVDTTQPPARLAAGPLSGLAVYDLLRGAAPGAHAVESVALPRKDFAALTGAGRDLWAAHWDGPTKTVLRGGVVSRYALDRDAAESAPETPPEGDAGRLRVEALGAAAQQLFESATGTSDELLERLRALGYVE